MSIKNISQEKLYKIILSPIVSEKTSIASANNQYTFKVAKESTKQDIKRSIELLFGVDVKAIQTMNVKGKQKVFSRKIGRRANWKKAIIKIAQGQMIDLAGA